jgi:hypothetical protein
LAFSGLNATARVLACLRIARAVVATGARLATDLPGSALVGSVSHRLDDKPDFMDPSFLQFHRTSIAWSHQLSAVSNWALTLQPCKTCWRDTMRDPKELEVC